MIPESDLFKSFFAGGFGMGDSQEPDIYVSACERAVEMLATGSENYRAFRDEFAAHIHDSSFTPLPNSSQWITDEWLRDIWYDAFGPEPPPSDPYPVPQEDWGHTRMTDYMLHAVNGTPEFSSPGASAWLEARGLTFADIDAAVDLSATRSLAFRQTPPEGYFERLKDLTDRGLREPHPDDMPPESDA